jgi:3-hydroxymyristoyl/3-hydroxydecanoyl-(acyl carrier protein) dehydratase
MHVPPAAVPELPEFDRHHLETFASGPPSKAFGRPYRRFDRERFIARLPRPPFLCIDRIVRVEPEPWVLKPDGWVAAEYELLPEAWYFRANRCPALPLGILMEIALQPCGWLAAYMGSALKSDKGLRFRNLGGEAELHRALGPGDGVLTTRTRLTQVSEVEDMIIQHYEFQVSAGGQPAYEGTTYFGFFTPRALSRQDGLRQATELLPGDGKGLRGHGAYVFEDVPPMYPEDLRTHQEPSCAFPAKALRMIDRIETYQPNAGRNGLGYVCGTKTVDPTEWFFKAHFHQDPVCPGSLGVESFIQLLKFTAANRYGDLLSDHYPSMLPGERHRWVYRGQVVPGNRQVKVEAVISELSGGGTPTIKADGILSVDGLPIYQLENFGIRLVPG